MMRRFDGPVCGALRTEREARGRKYFSILVEEKRVQSEEGSKNNRERLGDWQGAQMSPARFLSQ